MILLTQHDYIISFGTVLDSIASKNSNYVHYIDSPTLCGLTGFPFFSTSSMLNNQELKFLLFSIIYICCDWLETSSGLTTPRPRPL